ncbi:Domain of uncharacterised function (DUF3404) [Cedecea neteri]|uniref:Domain of uncharacterized function (DUF3404) n=1 Tax=Cedecea neteri TaxID=158822 RepID=A0A2X3J1C8_9ENTR|nr:Domain of uncharacterised function (DUF3404) [Cedecea neteri]
MVQRLSRNLRLALFYLCVSGWLPAAAGRGVDLTEQIAKFNAALSQAPPAAQVSLQTLQQLDATLLKPESMYPQFQVWSLPELTEFYHLDKRCASEIGLSAAVKSFIAALCQPNIPSAAWLAANPLYPLGGKQCLAVYLAPSGGGGRAKKLATCAGETERSGGYRDAV